MERVLQSSSSQSCGFFSIADSISRAAHGSEVYIIAGTVSSDQYFYSCMDCGNSQNEAPCNLTLRDITNTEGRRAYPPAEEQALTGINDSSDRKRKQNFYEGPRFYDKGKNEVIHSPQAYEACRHVKGKVIFTNAKPFDSQSSKGTDKSQGNRLVDELSLRGASSCQMSRLNSEADDSSIGPVAISNSEDEDISTESDEHKETLGLDEHLLAPPVHPFKIREESTFPGHTRLDWSLPSQKKSDFGEILAYDKLQNVSLCGSSPCSSCIKAAYMWSDLIYQDTRGRLSALKSSRRHARILEGKILRHEDAGETTQSQFKKAKSTESDLLQHWTSLLHCTEDTLLSEIVLAQSRLIEIEKLKDKFKRDLETTINSEPRIESEE